MFKEVKIRKILQKWLIGSLVFAVAVFLFGHSVFANADMGTSTEAIAAYNQNMIVKIINIILSILCLVDIGFVIYAGWLWTENEHDEDQVDRAKKILRNAGMGLAILIIIFILVNVFLSKVFNPAPNPTAATKPKNHSNLYSAAGNRAIEYHFPVMNQKDVARNSKIAITFREAIIKDAIVRDGKINSDNVFIYKTINGSEGSHLTSVRADVSFDGKTYVFTPEEKLGSPTESTWYTVSFSRNLKKINNEPVFTDIEGTIGYFWSFEIGVSQDYTPVRIESTVASPSVTEAKNLVIQVNFSDPIDPISLSGVVKDGFSNIVVKNLTSSSSEGRLPGTFYVSNLYRTVEFIPEETCGQNACAQTVYCLPSKSLVSVWIKAASTGSVSGQSDVSATLYPYDGAVDMNDNSIDGNSNGKSDGPQSQNTMSPYNANKPTSTGSSDDYVWSFYTNNEIDADRMIINDIIPKMNEYGINLDAIPGANFSRYILKSSLIKDNVALFFKPDTSEVFYWLTSDNATTSSQTMANMKHEQFYSQSDYTPQFGSGLKDIYQNCFSPSAGPSCVPDVENGMPYCCNGQKRANSCQN